MEEQNKVMKIISPGMCPHCSKEIMVAHRVVSPVIEWVLRPEDLERAKESVKDKVKKSKTINDDERKNILTWLEDENTKFGPAEVDIILSQISSTLVSDSESETEKKEDGS